MNENYKITLGILLVALLHIVVLFFLTILIAILSAIKIADQTFIFIFFLFPVYCIGIFQWIYIIPVIIWLKRRERWGVMKGVIIGAVLTALLNGGCWVWGLSTLHL